MSEDLRHQLAGVQSCRELLSKDPRDSIIEYVVGCVKMFAVHWSTFNLCRRSTATCGDYSRAKRVSTINNFAFATFCQLITLLTIQNSKVKVFGSI